MATKKTVIKEKSGVDKIIDYLHTNRDQIGAIVFSVSPFPGKQIPDLDDTNSDPIDMAFGASDRVFVGDGTKAGTGTSTLLTLGLKANIDRNMKRSGSIFG